MEQHETAARPEPDRPEPRPERGHAGPPPDRDPPRREEAEQFSALAAWRYMTMP